MNKKSRTSFGPIKVVLLAGGYGTRLAERTDAVPKPMVEVGGRPILWHIMKIYSRFGFNDFLIACGYRSEVIKRFFLEYLDRRSDLLLNFVDHTVERRRSEVEPWRVALVETGGDTMTGGRLKRLGTFIDTPSWCMTYGDGLADVDLARLVEFHENHGKLGTFVAVRPPSQFGRLSLDGDRVVEFHEKPMEPDGWINGGFFVLRREVLEHIGGDETVFESQVLPALATSGELMAFKHEGFWKPMDTLRDVRILNEIWDRGAPWKLWTD